MAATISNLGNELLVHILRFASPRDVESLTVASPVIARDVIPSSPIIWEHIFRHRWEALNFQLDGDVPLQINKYLDALFPLSCTLSRKFQLLAHAIIPVPSHADINETRKALGYTDAYHRIVSLETQGKSKPVDFTLDGGLLGDDRCVRANLPFPTSFHVAVYMRDLAGDGHKQEQTRPVYTVDVVSGGYFELSLSGRQHQNSRNVFVSGQEPMTSIGLVTSNFSLVDKQPGWTRTSYGYHGDDGRFYHGTPSEGLPFGPMFKSGCTVGCGMYIDPRTNIFYAFFTNNGKLVSSERREAYVECEHRKWYPAVGLDSYDALHLNFGQEPFVYSSVTDELFKMCIGVDMAKVVSEQLQWHEISDLYGEASKAKATESDNDSGIDFGSDISANEVSANFIRRILAMREEQDLERAFGLGISHWT